MRVALYARCSTAEQTVDLQLDGLRDYARARDFTVVDEYIDEAVSGAKARRPALDQLLADAHRRRFDAVLVWKLDRLGRSLSHLIRLVETVGRARCGSRLSGRRRARQHRP
jgi:DNA invertase Pin-like site-specific DNA recombinase